MMQEQVIKTITTNMLLPEVAAYKQEGWRLVQISATRLSQETELTYSFDRELRMENLRLVVRDGDRVHSISPVFWCAVLYENEIHDLFNVAIDGIAVDFKGNFYATKIKHPFGSTKAPAAPARAAKVVPSHPETGVASANPLAAAPAPPDSKLAPA